MRSIRSVVVWVWAGSLAGVLSGGCNDPAAARASAARWERVRQTAALYDAREANSPDRLESTAKLARQSEQRHAEKTTQNADRLRRWAERDIQHWDANQPLYREDLARRLKGDPAAIPGTFQAAFY